ncbi:MAG TPA: hypothetical protein VEK15_19145 [Vicinamibacteria bacterium]|nr:hypothetical protein [Vicinamibacteria bacterium]
MRWAALLSLGLTVLPPQPARPPPEKPSERFTVYVEAAPEAGAASDAPIEIVLREVVQGIKKRKKWLFLTSDPKKAEVFVRVLGHRVREEHVTALGTRVRYRGGTDGTESAIELVDTNTLSERHYLRASASALGISRMVVGHDGRNKGANLKRAASVLGEELEELLKEHYWTLEDRRRRAAAVGLDLPEPEVSTEAEVEPPPPEPDPQFASYLSAVDRYRQGSFVPAALSISNLTSGELYALGTMYLAADRPASEWKAAALLHTECVVTLPHASDSHLELARRSAQHLELAKRYAQAIFEPVQRTSFQKRWHLATAYYFHSRLRSTEAVALLSSGLQLFPGDPELLYSLGALHQTSGVLRGDRSALHDAEIVYRSLAAREAPLPDLDVRLAHVLLNLDRLDEARTAMEWATHEIGTDTELAASMIAGEIAAERRDWLQAREAFAMAWEIDPSCQACVVALAAALERTGRREASAKLVADWLASSSRDDDDGWWRFLLGPAARFEMLLDELRSEVLT